MDPGQSGAGVPPAVGECSSDDGHGRQVREVLDRIGDKWSVLVIVHLRHRSVRFGELSREIGGISQRMLTLTLRQLERDGLISRTAYAEVPPRVEYALTPLGVTLIGPLDALARWTAAHYPEIERHRAEFDER
jgi:DNA-binding HxlR family transcriptional regulator